VHWPPGLAGRSIRCGRQSAFQGQNRLAGRIQHVQIKKISGVRPVADQRIGLPSDPHWLFSQAMHPEHRTQPRKTQSRNRYLPVGAVRHSVIANLRLKTAPAGPCHRTCFSQQLSVYNKFPWIRRRQAPETNWRATGAATIPRVQNFRRHPSCHLSECE